MINHIVSLFKLQLKFEEKDKEVLLEGKKDEEVKGQDKKKIKNMLNREKRVDIKRIVVHLHKSFILTNEII